MGMWLVLFIDGDGFRGVCVERVLVLVKDAFLDDGVVVVMIDV